MFVEVGWVWKGEDVAKSVEVVVSARLLVQIGNHHVVRVLTHYRLSGSLEQHLS